MTRMLCVGKPSDWWSVPDEGNRLALMLCSVCPSVQLCSAGDPAPHAIIRGGVAYDGHGQVLPLCDCGRPVPYPERLDCYTCEPRKDTPLPVGGSGPAERHAQRIAELLAEGWTYRAIGLRIGSNAEAVRGVARRHGWRSKLSGRPQGSSTVVDAA